MSSVDAKEGCGGSDIDEFEGLWMIDDGLPTITTSEQAEAEENCAELLLPFSSLPMDQLRSLKAAGLVDEDLNIKLLRQQHIDYITKNLVQLPAGFVSLDASRAWIIYWLLHSLYLLGAEPIGDIYARVISQLLHMQNATGGYGGGPLQLSHCAPSYAAVLSLCTIGSDEALQSVNRAAMYHFYLSLKTSSGGFCMHKDGEVDVRGTYTVVAICSILNILTPELTSGVIEFLLSCQTYEGGFGGEPHNEAHGGYNFCALAALYILGGIDRCDLDGQERWLLCRQMKLEGGFQGRTNKLVDACYSFWQGAACAIVDIARREQSGVTDMGNPEDAVKSGVESLDDAVDVGPSIVAPTDTSGQQCYSQRALQRYLLHCSQQVGGGMSDKPGKSRDFYHTCYALSGLSVAQHPLTDTALDSDEPYQVYGALDNLLAATSPVYNIGRAKLARAMKFFRPSKDGEDGGRVYPRTHAELSASYHASSPI